METKWIHSEITFQEAAASRRLPSPILWRIFESTAVISLGTVENDARVAIRRCYDFPWLEDIIFEGFKYSPETCIHLIHSIFLRDKFPEDKESWPWIRSDDLLFRTLQIQLKYVYLRAQDVAIVFETCPVIEKMASLPVLWT